MTTYDFAVVGANGMQGKITTKDLLESGYSVLLCATDDFGLDSLIEHKKADFVQIDLRRLDRFKKVLKKSGATVVVNCAVDDFNADVARVCLDLGLNYVDLGAFEKITREQWKMDAQFKEKKILGIMGIGSTPGINNIMLRYIRPQFDTIHTVHLGFTWTSNLPVFVTPFSMDAIAWEFQEKAKILENGEWVMRAPDECNLDYYYKTIGKQKTFYTEHAEYLTFYEYLKDAGIKNIAVCSSFPKHSRDAINALIGLGFVSKDKIELDGRPIRPLDFTIEVMRRIPVPENYTEKEDIWLKVYGKKDGKDVTVEMDAIANTLPGWEDATCNIDTGMPASILAQMVLKGLIPEHGVFPPEFVVPPLPFFAELGRRKIPVYENGKLVNGPDFIKQYSFSEIQVEKATA